MPNHVTVSRSAQKAGDKLQEAPLLGAAAPESVAQRSAISAILHGSSAPKKTIERADPPIIQPKLTVRPEGDRYEQQADRVAAQVVDGLAALKSVSREPVQAPADAFGTKPNIQRLPRGIGGATVAPNARAGIEQARGGGQPLPNGVRLPMQRAFGADFSGVRIHIGARSDQLNRSINAHAFTTGTDIFFRQGTYHSGSRNTEKLLAHELTHVLQQTGGESSPLRQAVSPGDSERHGGGFADSRDSVNRATPSVGARGSMTTGGIMVQRLAVSEIPIEASDPPLIRITQLTGGHKGVVFLLENGAGKELVVKFQNEESSEAVIGTMIVRIAGAQTPNLREASEEDLDEISSGLQQIASRFPESVGAFEQARVKFSNALVMEFAPGRTIKKLSEATPIKLLQALQDREFQESLGRILAADAFSGNPDRAFAHYVDGKLKGWYHEQNLLIREADKRFSAVAIDNAFDPTLLSYSKTYPYGIYGGFGQFGSVAAANRTTAKIEAATIFERILKEIKKKHPDDKKVLLAVEELKKDNKKKTAFAEGVVAGAQTAMAKLLDRGQGWKKRLEAGGVSEQKAEDYQEIIEKLRQRKRFLHQLAGLGRRVTADKLEKARDRASKKDQYRHWVLTHQFGLSARRARAMLAKDKKIYKNYVKSHFPKHHKVELP